MPNRHSALTRIHTMVDTDHIYANAAARTGDTYATEDIGKLLWQQDNDSFWVLLTVAPTFSELGATGSQGDTGDQGDTGATGGGGAQGDTGDQGDTGVGSTTWLGLTDTDPASFAASAGKFVVVNTTPDGLEFSTPTIENSGADINMAGGTILDAILKDYGLDVDTQATASGATTIDLVNGNVHDITATAALTFTFSNPPASGTSGSFTLIMRMDGSGPWTITWPGTVDWEGDTAPTLTPAASAVDILSFFTVDGGTNWFGFAVGLDMKT